MSETGKAGKAGRSAAARRGRTVARTPGPRWRRRAEDRPDEVLDAALDLFIERGFDVTRVEDVARRAGLSKGAVYLYFPSKEAILEGLVRRAVVPVVANAAAIASSGAARPRDMIAGMLRTVAGRLGDPRLSAIPRLVIAEAVRFPELAAMYRREVIDRALAALEAVILRGIAEGDFRAVDARLATRNVIGPVMVHMLLGTVFRASDETPLDMDAMVESHLDILMNGLAMPVRSG